MNELFLVEPMDIAQELAVSVHNRSSAWRQKGLTGYWFKHIDRPFCLQADEVNYMINAYCELDT